VVTPAVYSNGVTVRGMGKQIWITIPGIGSVYWAGRGLVRVQLSPAWRGRTCGLCGDYNLAVVGDGEHVTLNDYWLVETADNPNNGLKSLFSLKAKCLDTTDHVQTQTHPCAVDVRTADARFAAAKTYCYPLIDPRGPYVGCHREILPQPFYEDCLFDYCGTGGTDACTLFKDYEARCEEAGVTDLPSVVDECGVCFGSGETCTEKCRVWGDPRTCLFVVAFPYCLFFLVCA
jgi:hypothetical protein